MPITLSGFPLKRGTPVNVTVTLSGKQQTVATLRRVTRGVALEIARALNTTILGVHRHARRLAPVGVSGRLRASITPVVIRASGATDALMLGGVFTNLEYAPFVEMGTSRLGKKTNRYDLPIGYVYGADHKYPGQIAELGFAKRGFNQGLRFTRKGLVPFPGIQLWAKRKGMDAQGVAWAIAGQKRGRLPGVRSQSMLRAGLAREGRYLPQRLTQAFVRGTKTGGAR